MPQATIIRDDGSVYTFDYALPDYSNQPAPVHIVSSRWKDALNENAVALVNGRWLAYHPTDDTKTQYTILDARSAGLLTGQTQPDDYNGSDGQSQGYKPTPQELRSAAYSAECDPIKNTVDAYILEFHLHPERTYLQARIALLQNEWDAKRDEIRQRYHDEA